MFIFQQHIDDHFATTWARQRLPKNISLFTFKLNKGEEKICSFEMGVWQVFS
jgi:hypothetical protein